jgi:hypothetical protein
MVKFWVHLLPRLMVHTENKLYTAPLLAVLFFMA